MAISGAWSPSGLVSKPASDSARNPCRGLRVTAVALAALVGPACSESFQTRRRTSKRPTRTAIGPGKYPPR